ncbi:MAG: hypothetical protein IPL32_18810 [Chloracidobacterium sp.]|nr:hypothetical protein [Chloracidobacterium sp.]
MNRKRNKDDAREYLLTVSKEGFDMLSVADKHLRRIERSLSLKEAA